MGAMDDFKQYIETVGVKNYLTSFHKDGVIEKWAENADAILKKTFPDDPNGVKLVIVGHVLLPFAIALLKDVPDGLGQARKLSGL